MSVVVGVNYELERLKDLDPELVKGGLAASALSLAEEMDSPNSATSKSMCARALREALDRLWELAPPVVERDRVESLVERSRLKLAAGS